MRHSFLLCAFAGYSIVRLPLFETICSAVKGLLVCLHLESPHQAWTRATSARKARSSFSTEAMTDDVGLACHFLG